MKRNLFRRILSAVLSAVMVLSIFAVGGISAGAASNDDVLRIVIKGVTRKYPLSYALFNEINKKRSSGSQLTMDADLVEQAMERASQLSLYPNPEDITGDTFGLDDGNGFDAVGVISNYNESLSASSVLDALLANTDSFDIDRVASASETEMKYVGVGAALISGNKNKLFVCVRVTSVKSGSVKAYNSEEHPVDESVDQGTFLSTASFNKCTRSVVIFEEDGTIENTTTYKLSKGKNYTIVLKLNSFDNNAYKTITYILPKVESGTVTVTDGNPAYSYLYYTQAACTKSFTPKASSMQLSLKVDSFEQSVTLTSDDEYEEITKMFNADDITVEPDTFYYDGVTQYFPTITVRDHYTHEVLTKCTSSSSKDGDYYHSSFAKVGDSLEDKKYSVSVIGKNDYKTSGTIVVSYSVVHGEPEYSVSLEKSHTGDLYSSYTDKNVYYANENVRITATTPDYTDSNITFTCTGPDGKSVEGSTTPGSLDSKFDFVPSVKGNYTIKASAEKDGKTASDTITVTVTEAINLELTISDENPEVGSEITLTAVCSGGVGSKKYTLLTESGAALLNSSSENTAKYTVEAAGTYKFTCRVVDENNKSMTVYGYIVGKAVKTYPTIIGRNLALGGEIGINLYCDMPSKNYTVVITTDDKEEKIPASEGYQDSNANGYMGKYIFTIGVPVADMDKEITVTVLDAAGDSAPLYANNGNENVRLDNDTYTVTVNGTMDATVTAYPNAESLAKATYSYGAFANKYFRNNDIDSNKIENQADIDKVTAQTLEDEGYALRTEGELPTGVSFTGFSLLLEEKTSVRVYVKVTDPKAVTFKIGDDVAELETAANGSTYICAKNISANKLGNPITFSAVSGTKTYSVRISPLTYAHVVLSRYDGTAQKQELCQLMKSMYCYFESAVAYL